MNKKPNIIVILGPTASGKSALAIKIAKKFNGEVISADSRQVYTGLDIGTGKITKKEMAGIPHHLLDVASPKSRKVFTVKDFKNKAEKSIESIIEKNKVPIICGGTGFYIQALVDNFVLPEVPPNLKLRKKLENILKNTPKNKKESGLIKLNKILEKLDPARAKNIDKNNPRRIIRAIEIAEHLGKVPALKTSHKYRALQIGIKTDDKILREKIHVRLLARMKLGMVREVENLHKTGLSWKKMESLGLEYRYLAYYLQKKISKENMLEKLETEIWHYAKRQKTWFKRDSRIRWFKVTEEKKTEKLARKFLENKYK